MPHSSPPHALPLLALALPPFVLAVVLLGRVHPDEVYQVLEPAWHRVHGYGLLAWEWRVGLRNWAWPGLVAGVLWLARALGVGDPQAARALVALPQLALHVLMLRAAYRYALRRTAHAQDAWMATALLALSGPVLLFAGRTLGESTSAACAVLAAVALEEDERPWRAGVVGGAWLGLAVVLRYGSAVLVLGALAWLGLSGRRRTLAGAALGGGVVALLLGALDWATWGAPFHSLVEYLRFNLVSGEAERQFGREPWSYYARPLALALPLWVLGALPDAWTSVRARVPLALPGALAALYLLAVAVTPHKEERFLYPAVVLVVLWAAPVVSRRMGALPGWARALVLAVSLGVGLAPYALYPDVDTRGDQFRAELAVARDPATRGVLLVNEGRWGAGGAFYLGRPLPWATCDWPEDPAFQHAMRDPRFNRALTFEGRALEALEAHGFRVVGRVGRESVLAR